jgi:hypothetical protein
MARNAATHDPLGAAASLQTCGALCRRLARPGKTPPTVPTRDLSPGFDPALCSLHVLRPAESVVVRCGIAGRALSIVRVSVSRVSRVLLGLWVVVFCVSSLFRYQFAGFGDVIGWAGVAIGLLFALSSVSRAD